MTQQNNALAAKLSVAKNEGGDIAQLSEIAEGVQVRRTEDGYMLQIAGDPKEALQTLEKFEEGMKKVGITANASNYRLHGVSGLVGTYILPMEDVPEHILEARQLKTGETIAKLSNSAAASGQAALHAAEEVAPPHANVGRFGALFGKFAGVLGLAVAPVITYLATGSAAEAAEAAVPGAQPAREGRVTETVLQGASGAASVAETLVAFGIGSAAAPAIAAAGFVVLVGNEVGRPLLRLAGVDVDPSLAQGLYEDFAKINEQQLARLKNEMGAGELRQALIDPKSELHQLFENNYAVEYKAKIAQLKGANDGELPVGLPRDLLSPEAYVASRFRDEMQSLSGLGDAIPTGINRNELAQAAAAFQKHGVCGGEHINASDSGVCTASVQLVRNSSPKNGMAAGV